MSAELSQYDLITLLISSIAVIMSLVAFINARQHAIIESFISMVNAFFTQESRNARRDLRKNKILSELRNEVDPNILVEKEDLPKKDMDNIWELVSAYNRLGFVLHNYPRFFLLLSLKTKFLKWDAETVIDMWERVRLYIYKERIVDLARSEVGDEFEWLYNEAVEYQKRKSWYRWFKPNIIGWLKARIQDRTVFRYHQEIKYLYNDGKKLKSLYNDDMNKLKHTKKIDDLYEDIANDHNNKKISYQQCKTLKNKISALYSQIYDNEINSFRTFDRNVSMQLDLIKKNITNAHSAEKVIALHYDLLNKNIEKIRKRGDNSVRLIAIHLAKNGLGDKLLNILVKVIEPTRMEEGNIAYVLHRSMDNPDELMFDEIWADNESLEAHLKQPYITSAVEQMTSILAKPVELRRYSEIGG